MTSPLPPLSDVEAIARTLVAIPSVNPVYDPASPGTPAMIAQVARFGEENGFEVTRFPVPGGLENLVLRLENGPGPHLLYNGHLDTVSVEGMTIDPFGAEIREGRLWGRGSTDMKGPVAAMLSAAGRLREQRDRWRGTLTLGFTPDEEVASNGIRALITQIPRPDFAIVGEPSGLAPIRGCKGGARLTLTAHGLAAHSSRPQLGRSAVVAMSRAVLALEGYFERVLGAIRRPRFGPSTGSIGLIRGGSGINIVPETCTIHIDIRLIPGQDPQKTIDDLERWFRGEFPEGAEGIRWTFNLLRFDPPFEIAPDHPFTRLVCDTLGYAEEPDVAFYCCDASKIAAIGVPCLILGPGEIAQAHTADEFLALDALHRGVELYERLALRLLR